MSTEITRSEYEVSHSIELSPQVLADYDVIVPDYQPDLLKILQVDANAVVLHHEVQNDRITITGKVDYKILYVPASATGVASIITSAPFNHIEEHPSAKQDMMSHVSCDVEHVEFQFINSRKIGIKTVVSLDITLVEAQKISTITDMSGEDIELRKRVFRTSHRVIDRTCGISISDTLAVPVGQPSIQSLIKSDVSIRNKDVKVISNKVVTKGDLVVCSLYSAEQETMPVCTCHEIPFTEILDADGIAEDQNTHIAFSIESADVKAVPDVDGDMRNLSMDVKIDIQISSDEVVEAEAVYDAYSTQNDLQLTTSCLELQEVNDYVSGQSTVKAVINIPSDVPPLLQVYNVIAKPYVNSATVQGGRVIIDGSIDAYVLYISEKEDNLLSNFKEEIPFRMELDCNNGDSSCSVNALCDVSHVSYNITTAGEVETRIIIDADANVFKTSNVDIVTDVKALPLESTDDSSIVLYYVQKSDSLWEIAKRYHTKISKIQEVNHLSEDGALEAGAQLLIPKS